MISKSHRLGIVDDLQGPSSRAFIKLQKVGEREVSSLATIRIDVSHNRVRGTAISIYTNDYKCVDVTLTRVSIYGNR